jgi:predicted nuclease with TOPRIM domain
MRTKFTLLFTFLTFHFAFSANIIKSPGDTIDVFTEITSFNNSNPLDTVFIDGGTGTLFLKAGPVDDGVYDWNFNEILTSYIVNFSFVNALETISETSKGALVTATRSNPVQERYFWVVYRNLPVKPSIPDGPSNVCAGTNSIFTSFSLNAESYEWIIEPIEAGTLTFDTTNTVTVEWNSSYTGNSVLRVRGLKGEAKGQYSDDKNIIVGTVPGKPTIEGDNFVEIGTTSIYKATSDDTASLSWSLTPDYLATFNQEGNQITVNFAGAGSLLITAYTTNVCGNSSESDGISVKIVDLNALEEKIDSLEAANTELNEKIDKIVADSTQSGAKYRIIIEGLIAEKQVLEDQLILFILKLNEALASNEELTNRIAELEFEKQNLNEQLALLNEQLALLNLQLNDALASNEILSDQIDELQKRILELEDEMLALNEQFEILTGVLNNTLLTVEELSSQIDELENRITDLENEKLSLEEKVSDLESANAILIDQISELESQLEILSQVYILQWEVKEVTTKTFETEIGNFSISLYPNPSPGEIFIDCTEEIKEIKIFDFQGQLVKKIIVNALKSSFKVNRTEMPSGTYFINIETMKGNSKHKIIFQ